MYSARDILLLQRELNQSPSVSRLSVAPEGRVNPGVAIADSEEMCENNESRLISPLCSLYLAERGYYKAHNYCNTLIQ
jgi:hypothetical protein